MWETLHGKKDSESNKEANSLKPPKINSKPRAAEESSKRVGYSNKGYSDLGIMCLFVSFVLFVDQLSSSLVQTQVHFSH